MDRVSVHYFHLELPGRQVLLTFDEHMHISTPHTWNYLFFLLDSQEGLNILCEPSVFSSVFKANNACVKTK